MLCSGRQHRAETAVQRAGLISGFSSRAPKSPHPSTHSARQEEIARLWLDSIVQSGRSWKRGSESSQIANYLRLLG